MKKFLFVFLAMVMVFTNLYAGGSQPDQKTGVSSELAARKKWAEDNGLNKTETVAELYEKAKKEGVMNIYGCTGRIADVAKSFMADYPGITVNFYDLTINDMLEKFSREYAAGVRTADILNPKDEVGNVYNEYVKTGLLHNYHPSDIFGDIVDPAYLALTPFVLELEWWNFNTEKYSDLPIDSWWDITKPEWKGKYVFLDPTTEPSLPALFAAMVQNNDMMVKEYQRVFGKPIVLDKDEPDAAHAWIKRIARNGIILVTSNTDIVDAVGSDAGMKDPPLGYGVSSKLRERDKQGWRLGVHPNKFPTPTSVVGLLVAQIADQAPHPNAAKLFVRYLCGEAGHKGKGLEPFKSAGSYPAFKGAEPFANQPKWADVPLFKFDLDYLYANYMDVSDYWLSVQQ